RCAGARSIALNDLSGPERTRSGTSSGDTERAAAATAAARGASDLAGLALPAARADAESQDAETEQSERAGLRHRAAGREDRLDQHVVMVVVRAGAGVIPEQP